MLLIKFMRRKLIQKTGKHGEKAKQLKQQHNRDREALNEVLMAVNRAVSEEVERLPFDDLFQLKMLMSTAQMRMYIHKI